MRFWKKQSAKIALERSGWRTHRVPAGYWAGRCVDYAVLSANVYATRSNRPMDPPAGWEEVVTECVDDAATGLYYEVWESKLNGEGLQTVVVFRGTRFTSLKDWRSNLRWFLRFLPGKDQYDVVRERIAGVVTRAQQRHGTQTLIVTTGHSLGGGLAQQAAYAHPEIKQVYAFHPSPVTGFQSVPAAERNRNRVGIAVVRIFEHGEILAYVRLVLKYFVRLSLRDAKIMEVRLNLQHGDAVGQHSMETFARDLAAVVKVALQAVARRAPQPVMRMQKTN